MQLIINGKRKDAPALATVADLAAWMELPAYGSAVELNGQVLRRAEYPDWALAEGDRLEVVRLVGGG